MDVSLETIQSSIEELKRITTLSVKETLSVDELSEVYGLKKSYIYQLVHYKRIPYYKAAGGRLTYFKKSEVEKFLLSDRVGTIEEAEQQAARYLAERR